MILPNRTAAINQEPLVAGLEMATTRNDRLLLVDDEQSVLSALRRLFRRDGYEVATAANAAAALAQIARRPPHLIICDQRMPGMSGVELLAQLRRRCPDAVRILLTAYADTDAAVAAINEGRIYRFIHKPWNDDELRATVKEALEQRHFEQEDQALTEKVAEQNAELRGLSAELEERVRKRTEQLRDREHELEGGFAEGVRCLVGLLELRDGELAAHSKRVSAWSRGLADQLGMPEDAAFDVEIGSLLHDVGKIGLPGSGLTKAPRRLLGGTDEHLRRHPVDGQAIIHMVTALRMAGFIVRHHHERWDGQGYPDGRRGIAIPIGARIVAIADAYDHGLRGSTGLFGMGERHTPTRLRKGRGSLYDPELVDLFVETRPAATMAEHGVAEVRIPVRKLSPNMVLARNLYDRRGRLVSPEGQVLQLTHIQQLQKLVSAKAIAGPVYVYERDPYAVAAGRIGKLRR